ncbi:hypothetical protein TGRH88_086210 [Toxoplasma gondii]|uniref:Uncharacterized protein n=1 Tax=Toxoplasma gondii TaxID=5811 RepID=A0A7J6KFU6_TOXGO|nr:hypothetical protein TGRH88_086210 [Toxoplasma gondii]
MRGRVACGGPQGSGRYDSLGYLGERVNPGSSHVHGTGGASQRVDSGDGGGDVIMRWGLPSNASRAQDRQDDSTPVELEIRFHSVTVAVDMVPHRESTAGMAEVTWIMRWGLPSNASRAQDRQDDSTPVELEIRFHSVTVAVDMGSGRYDSLGYLGERVNPGSSHVHGASQRVDSGDGGGDVIMRWGLPSNASRAQDRQDDSTPVELEIRFHSVTVAVDMGSGRYDSLGYLGERVNPGSSHVHGASQRVDSGDGGGDVVMRWGLPSNASRAQDRQDDSTPVELEIRFHSVTVAVDMEPEVRDSEQACSVVRRSCHYMSRLGFGYTVQRGASQRVDSGDGGGDVIMRWGLPSNASRAQDRQDDSTPVELEIRFHSVTVAVDMEPEVRDSEQACSVVRRSCHYMSRLGFGYTVQRGASQRVDSGDGGGDVVMRWGLPSNASRAQDRQDDSTPVELEIRFHSVTVAVDMGSGRYDSLGYLGERVNPGSSHVHGASQRVDSGDGGGDVIMRWGLPSNASRAQDRQDDSTPVELEIRFHSVTVAVDMGSGRYDSLGYLGERVNPGSSHVHGASQRVDSGDGGGDVIMRWGLPSNASRAQDRQDDSTPVELEIRFHSVTVAVDMGSGRYDSLGYLGERVNPGSSHVHGASQRVDSGDGGGDVIMRWGLPSNASRAQDRQDDSTPVELEIRFHSVTVAVDMDRQDDSTPVELEIRFHSVTVAVDMDRQDDSTPVELEIRFHSVTVAVDMGSGRYDSLGYLGERVNPGSSHVHGASQRVDSGDGGGDVIMRWGLPSNASRAQDRQDDSTPVELEIRFHSVTVAVDMGSGRYDSLGYLGERVNPGSSHVHGASQRVDSGDGGGDVIMRWGLPSNASRAQDRQDDSTPVELEIRFHSVTVAVDMGSGRYDSLGYLGERVNPGSSHVHGASQRVDSGDGGGDVVMRWGLPSNASRAQDRQDDSTPVELEIRFHSVTVAVDMGSGRYDSLGYLGERVNPGSSHVHGASQRVDSGDGGGDVVMRWGLPSNASRAQDRQDDSTPVELEIRFHSVTVAVDMGSGRYDSLGYLGERVNPGSSHVHGASQRVDSGDGGGDVIMRWGLPSNASRAQDRQDDSTPVELEIRFHSVTVAVDMGSGRYDSLGYLGERVNPGSSHVHGASQRVDSGDGGGDVVMRWGLPSNASRAQDRQDDSTPVELEIRFHSVTVAVDMGSGRYDSLGYLGERVNPGSSHVHGASQRVDSGDGGGDVIMRWGLPSNASRAQDRQDDSTPVELEIRFHSVTVAVDMGSGRYDSLGYLGERVNPGSSHVHGASQRVDSGDGGGDVIMRWGLPSNASRAQDRQDDSTPVELEIRFHSVTVAVDMGSGRYDSLGYLGERVNPGSSHVHGASQRVDSGDGGGDVIMRWGLPSNASRAQDRQDDSTPVELEIRFHSVTVAVDMGSGRYDSLGYLGERVNPGSSHVHGASQRVDSGDGGGDVIMRWGLPSNASRAQDRQDDSTPVELEIRFHSVTVAVDMVPHRESTAGMAEVT